MRRDARRGTLLPLTSATLLSVAAGLSLAGEHIVPSAATRKPPPVTANAPEKADAGIKLSPQGTPEATPGRTAAKDLGAKTGTAGGGGAEDGMSVGSRALTGGDDPAEAASRPAPP